MSAFVFSVSRRAFSASMRFSFARPAASLLFSSASESAASLSSYSRDSSSICAFVSFMSASFDMSVVRFAPLLSLKRSISAVLRAVMVSMADMSLCVL